MNKNKLRPYHIFKHNGQLCLINVEDSQAYKIDDAISTRILNHTATNTTINDCTDNGLFIELGLLSEKPLIQKPNINSTPSIVSMNLLITQTCNLKCSYCYGDWGNYGNRGDMDRNTALKAIDWLIKQSADNRNLHVGFFGGEPLLKYGLMKDIVYFANHKSSKAGKKIFFNCTTNGTLLTKEIVNFFKKNKIKIMVSIDGPKEVQDAQRPFINGKGTYDVVVQKVKELLGALPNTSGHSVIAENCKPDDVIKTLQSIGFNHITFSLVSLSLFDDIHTKNYSSHYYEQILGWLEVEAEEWINWINNKDTKSLLSLKGRSFLYKAISSILNKKKKYFACGAGIDYVGVAASGDVYLCHRFIGIEEYKIGNVFTDVINSDRFVKSLVLDDLVCSQCFAKYYCAGGCMQDNLSQSGSIEKPPQNICEIRRREYELAAYIISCLDPKEIDYLRQHDIIPPKPCLFDF